MLLCFIPFALGDYGVPAMLGTSLSKKGGSEKYGKAI